MDLAELKNNARRASTLLKAMSNEKRLLILCQILKNECSVGELERLVGLSQSALSQHLARLRRDGLVRTRREAQTIYYSVSSAEVRAIIDVLCRLYAPEMATRESAGRGLGGAAR